MRRTPPVAPFRRADPDGIRTGPWRLADTGEELGDRVEHWDPDLVLRLDRDIVVEVDTILESTGIESAESLALAAVWRSDRTRLRGPGMSVSLAGRAGEARVTLALDLPGHLAGGSLELRTVLIRAGAGPARIPIVAGRAGAILWDERVSIALEGSAARFPVTVLDFTDVPGLDGAAAWALEWSPQDLDQPVLGAMRLLVNSAMPAAVTAISAGEDSGSAAIASMVRFDVARSLIHGALATEQFVSNAGEFEVDSVGRMLEELIERYWPGVPADLLNRRLAETPHRLESELQAMTGLLAT